MKTRKLKIVLISIAAFLIVAFAAFYVYTLDYYRASGDVYEIEEFKNAAKTDVGMVFKPSENADVNTKGIIFYPGGKVEAEAYAPLLIKLADKGYTCVLLQMPFNLAVFDINAAEGVYDEFPAVTDWYLMGHSLGGAMASSYCEKNYDKLEGLILLGAYPLNDADIDTLTIYGTEDFGLDYEKLENAKNVEFIDGGNHAYFGNYGEQKGDGTAEITRQQQQDIAVELIVDFIR